MQIFLTAAAEPAQLVITMDGIVRAAGILGALGVLVGFAVKAIHWFDRQADQDTKLAALEAKHDSDKEELRAEMARELASIKEEQSLIVYGLLAVLKGQQEQGCNGPVTEASGKLEKHINQKAHMNGGYFHD